MTPNTAAVLNGSALWSIDQGDALEWLRSLPADSVDCLVSSPPYCDARTYGIDAQRDCVSWVEWMYSVALAAQHAVKGPMFWVVGGVTRERNYWPACEGLAWEWWRRGQGGKLGDCQLYRPCIFDRVGIPGSGGDDYLRADWEYVICMKRPGKLPWSDNTACGHPPKWAPGGEMSHRVSSGARVNQWGHSIESGATVVDAGGVVRSKGKRPSHTAAAAPNGVDLFGEPPATPEPTHNAFGVDTTRPIGTRPGGDKGKGKQKGKESYRAKDVKRGAVSGYKDGDTAQDGVYVPPVLANPGNSLETKYTADEVRAILAAAGVSDDRASQLVKGMVGGGLMGSDLAHENEAPFPEWLAEFFVRSFCPEGGTVADCFSGSGTTGAVVLKWGRRFIGCDLRQSQVDLTTRRLKGEATLFD